MRRIQKMEKKGKEEEEDGIEELLLFFHQFRECVERVLSQRDAQGQGAQGIIDFDFVGPFQQDRCRGESNGFGQIRLMKMDGSKHFTLGDTGNFDVFGTFAEHNGVGLTNLPF